MDYSVKFLNACQLGDIEDANEYYKKLKLNTDYDLILILRFIADFYGHAYMDI